MTTSANAPAIAGAPTSIPVFIGACESGPVLQPTRVDSWTAYQAQFGRTAWGMQLPWSVMAFFVHGGTSCYVVRAPDTAPARASGTAMGNALVRAATAGTWGNSLLVALDGSSTSPVFSLKVLAAAQPADLLLARYINSNIRPMWDFGGKAYAVLEQFDGLGAQDWAKSINERSLFVRVADGGQAQRPPNSAPIALQGGTQPRHDHAAAGQLLQNIPEASLLALPDLAEGPAAEQAAQAQATLALCEKLGSVFYVVDPPPALDTRGVVEWRAGLGHSGQGALYHPWVDLWDAQAGVSIPAPPSGAVLGRYVCMDGNRGIFTAPIDALDGVTGLLAAINDDQTATLTPAGVNALRGFPGRGYLIWGSRTLTPDHDLLYVPVRRTQIWIEQSLKQSLAWTASEPNGPVLWNAVTTRVVAFLGDLWRQGGLVGSAPSDAFQVVCNVSNNPPSMAEPGVLHLDMLLAFTHPAEFIVLRVELGTA